jgi:TadE-like protein
MMRRTARQRRRGNAFLEFALVFILLITLMVAAFEFTWVLFIRATFHHAVREAVRAAITANPPPAYTGAFDNYLKSVIKTNTLGLVSDAQLDEHVEIKYFDANCAGQSCPISDPEPGSIVRVSILCYDVFPITSLIQRRDPQTGKIRPFTVNITSSDKVEPFPGVGPARGTQAVATACNAT